MQKAFLAVALVLSALLAGCGGAAEETTSTTQSLAAGKGGISGLVIDDRYRPIPNAVVLLFPLGLQATADGAGQVVFNDLDPGSYQLRVSAKDHEAAPAPIDVEAGEYAEVELQARRVFSQDGIVITTQYSVFIDCSFETPVLAGTGAGCAADGSGDSTRTGFDTHLDAADANLTTWMVTEVLYNQVGDYGVVIGVVDGTNTYETYYSEADGFQTDYMRIQNKANATNEREGENVGGRNVAWPPAKAFSVSIFPHGEFYRELHEAGGLGLFGAGVDLGVKAQIVQTIFLGQPQVDVDSYAVLRPS